MGGVASSLNWPRRRGRVRPRAAGPRWRGRGWDLADELVDRRHPEMSKSAGDPVGIASPPPGPTRPRARGCRGSRFLVRRQSIVSRLSRLSPDTSLVARGRPWPGSRLRNLSRLKSPARAAEKSRLGPLLSPLLAHPDPPVRARAWPASRRPSATVSVAGVAVAASAGGGAATPSDAPFATPAGG